MNDKLQKTYFNYNSFSLTFVLYKLKSALYISLTSKKVSHEKYNTNLSFPYYNEPTRLLSNPYYFA